ncbi:MAG: sn-glycerol-3-phosphate ABC transporter ATP-binding protein UgpC [Legionellales bacterium]|nr:sn-glycerol-3-phosphate ABC transporter ATP-binding protein UgpC [Legionellales bacterium]
MATVDLIGVNQFYHDHQVLHDIHLRVEKGEFVAVVGPSGSGKSTLLRLVAGLEPLSSGQILINNQCVNQTPPAARDIAMVFQNYALYPHMTVYDNMAYGLKMRRVKKNEIERRVKEVAQLLQLGNYLQRLPLSLSGGQRQRVAMGRAIVRSPAVFLFDEPLSNLDAKLRAEMRHEIKKLHQQLNTTCIYVTHDQTEAMTMADRIVVLNHGRVEQIGTPRTLYQNPASLFVASFMGHYPMNFFQASIDVNKDIVMSSLAGPWARPTLRPPVSSEMPVVVGIRPEHIFVSDKPEPLSIPVTVAFMDDLGADKLIQGVTDCGKINMLVRIPGDQDIKNNRLSLHLELDKAHVFCEQTGARIGGWNEEEKKSRLETR